MQLNVKETNKAIQEVKGPKMEMDMSSKKAYRFP